MAMNSRVHPAPEPATGVPLDYSNKVASVHSGESIEQIEMASGRSGSEHPGSTEWGMQIANAMQKLKEREE